MLVKAFTRPTDVRPLLEYCTPVWSPCSMGLIKKLDIVQKNLL